MIWLVWRRYRVLIALTVVVLAALGVWMLLLGHATDAAESSSACRYGAFRCTTRSGIFSLSDQATAINFLLLFVPCLLGIVFGAPLVAGEIEHSTNRLVWTQGVSRTRWIIVKWCSLGLLLLVLVSALTLITQWWAGHSEEPNLDLVLIGSGPLQPLFFPITGLAMSAYTAFAFAMGAAFGAVIRKTSWAVAGTVVLYAVVSVVMVLYVRPSLEPQAFLVFHESVSGQGIGDASNSLQASSWGLGFGYRYAPGASGAKSGPSADIVGKRCQLASPGPAAYLICLSYHRVQQGEFYQPANRYWGLQWRESLLLVATAGALFGATVLSVRRWKA
jgi:ABC-type transport system involved in multi-copper enzyme maturation permease subunit